MGNYSAWHALTGEHGPAPKEEGMSRLEETKLLLRNALRHQKASPENDQLQDLFESLCHDLALCAASPWCFDTENIPRVEGPILAMWHKPSLPETVYVTSLYWWEDYKTWRGHGFNVREEWFIAFSIINPPQVKS